MGAENFVFQSREQMCLIEIVSDPRACRASPCCERPLQKCMELNILVLQPDYPLIHFSVSAKTLPLVIFEFQGFGSQRLEFTVHLGVRGLK